MNRSSALERAIALVSTALGAGWCTDETGKALGDQVAEAIEIITEKIAEIGAR